jgi:chromosome partitioning protein
LISLDIICLLQEGEGSNIILIVGSTKGGVGKTTLAFNFTIALSRAGREVLLVDADRQETAMINTKIRKEQLGEPGYTAVSLYDEQVLIQVPGLAKKYDDVIVDVGGRDNPSLRSALLVPHATLLIPVKPRSYELWGADDTIKLVKTARASGNTTLRAVAVINEADHLQDADNAGAVAELREKEGLEVAPIRLVRRKAYPDAAAYGKGVLEYKDPKASQELMDLLTFLHPQYNAVGAHAHGTR